MILQDSLQGHRRYLGFNHVLRSHFGEKVYRVTLNSGLSCPNIDGTKAKGGCYFCNDDYLLAKSWHKQLPLEKQLSDGITYVRERHPHTKKFLAYFQNGTNTHANVSLLRPMFEQALSHPEVCGLLISTRPDSLPEDVLDLLSELNEKTYLWIETGLQSTQNHVLKKINRAHTVEEFAVAAEALAKRKIRNCVHMILGMPGESFDEAIHGIDLINQLPVNGIKIHNLFVTEFTLLAKWYREGLYQPMTLEQYSTHCVDYIERLRPDIVIHRVNAHAPARLTVAPEWSINKLQTVNAIHDELIRRNTWQGRLHNSTLSL